MPGYDGTGPNNQGPMTGRGLGFCPRGNGFGFRQGFGRGLGRARRFGFRAGFQQMQPVQFSEADEKKVLEAELKELEAEKDLIQKRLKELK